MASSKRMRLGDQNIPSTRSVSAAFLLDGIQILHSWSRNGFSVFELLKFLHREKGIDTHLYEDVIESMFDNAIRDGKVWLVTGSSMRYLFIEGESDENVPTHATSTTSTTVPASFEAATSGFEDNPQANILFDMTKSSLIKETVADEISIMIEQGKATNTEIGSASNVLPSMTELSLIEGTVADDISIVIEQGNATNTEMGSATSVLPAMTESSLIQGTVAEDISIIIEQGKSAPTESGQSSEEDSEKDAKNK